MAILLVLGVMFPALNALLLTYFLGYVDSYKREIRKVSEYLDTFVVQLSEHHMNERDAIDSLRKLVDQITSRP